MSGATTAYDPQEIEQKWTKYWFAHKLLNFGIADNKPAFSIALPPPNITGSLHMGHALNGTLQDILIRWKRMQGYNVLWQAGVDHAGISMQMVVERQLRKEGKIRQQLGRENFLTYCFNWRNQYGNTIYSQYQRLGVSFSWDRLAYTMDESYVKAIYGAFVQLYKEGFIYRGNRITNWCPGCQTSLSDLEVEHEEIKGQLYFIGYPLSANDEKAPTKLTIATTRPESMFGDVAVAINPLDARYSSLVGKTVILPLSKRHIPVIADEHVDMKFGTGVLKVTPAHDANDWEIGLRHQLPSPNILDQNAKLANCENVPPKFQGLERFEARKQVTEELSKEGFLEDTQEYYHGIGLCERCRTVIEPQLSSQWYVAMKDLAKPALASVEEGQISFVPARYASTYLDWMRNVRDWNISRQLWWGQRIPVWVCKQCLYEDAYVEQPSSCPRCQSSQLEQDPDVLDTWFSSALWPYATLGWPHESAEFKTFYPTSILSTARDIINLWVARMIFTSLKFTGKIPFKHVLVHPVIQTADGKRMSKTKGNAVDPLDMIEKYGADANRFWFASVGIKGDQDVRFREDRLQEYKRFVNKLWNAGRFVMSQLEGYTPKSIDPARLSLADRWILSSYNKLLEDLHRQLEAYDFHEVSQAFYEFIWDDFCDWYVEIAKIQLASERVAKSDFGGQSRNVLYLLAEGLVRALHPIMPFITEELWYQLPRREDFLACKSIMFARYPETDKSLIDKDVEENMEFVIRIIRAIRNIRQTYSVPAAAIAEAMMESADVRQRDCLSKASDYIQRLARVNLVWVSQGSSFPMTASETILDTKIYIPLKELIDVSQTKARLKQRRGVIAQELLKVRQILGNENFANRAPQDKVEALRSQLIDLENQNLSVESQLNVLG